MPCRQRPPAQAAVQWRLLQTCDKLQNPAKLLPGPFASAAAAFRTIRHRNPVSPLRLDHTSRFFIAIALMMALLCAQWAGQWHRVAHAGGLHQLSRTVAATQADAHDDAGHDLHHSCSLFDAAALASGIPSTLFDLPSAPGVNAPAPWVAFLSWQAPFACFFSSRAPPPA